MKPLVDTGYVNTHSPTAIPDPYQEDLNNTKAQDRYG